MEFKFRSMDAAAHAPQNQMYRTHSSSSSSTYTYFTEQAIRAGLPRGNFARQEMYRGPSGVREAIQREIEKERIREEIIAEEIARKRVLEAEVRRELMMEREMMAMRSGGGFSSSFMPPPPNQSNLFERRMLHRQPIGLEERIAWSLEEKYGGGGRRREIGGFEMVPFQRHGHSPKIKEIATPVSEDRKQKVIVLGEPNGGTLSGTKRKPTPSVASGSTVLRSDGSRKKQKEEWSCAICQVTATSERGLNEHLEGKKHQAKEAALRAQRTGANLGLGVAPNKPTTKPVKIPPSPLQKKLVIEKKSVKTAPSISKMEDGKTVSHKREKFKFWCEMCQVGAFSEKVMKHHSKGKKHLTNLLELSQKREVKAAGTEKACDSQKKPEAETKKAAFMEVFPEVKSANDDHEVSTGDSVNTEVKIVKEADTKENSDVVAEVKTVRDDMEADTMIAAENNDGRDEEDNTIKTGEVADNESV